MVISNRCKSIKPSEIREVFNKASTCSNLINLGIGEPDFKTPRHIIDYAKKALDDGLTSYTHNMGIYELREKLSEKLKNENKLDISPNNIIITCGASEGLMLSLMSLINPNDEVIIPNPGFVSYSSLVSLCEGKIKSLVYDDNFRVDIDKLNEIITDKTKCIILNSPSNPTGAVMGKREIKGICEIAEDNNIIIISDEIYEKIIYDDVKHHSPMEYTDNCILINGFSKSYAMTGWRIGYVGVNENLNSKYDIINNMLKIHQYSVACATSFAQYGALGALLGDQGFIKNMVEEFKRRRDLMCSELKDIFKIVVPKGAFYLFPYVGDYGTGKEVSNKLLENGILSVPGSAFGDKGLYYVRFSYANSYENIKQAVDIIKEIYG